MKYISPIVIKFTVHIFKFAHELREETLFEGEKNYMPNHLVKIGFRSQTYVQNKLIALS